MILDQEIPELRQFKREESRLPFVQKPGFGPMVIYGKNDTTPIHNWFRFKEGFSADLLPEVVKELTGELGKRIKLLDPFCGAGTVLVSAQELSRQGYEVDSVGIERNPFIAFVARTKSNASRVDPQLLLARGKAVISDSKTLSPPLPELSSIHEGRCISRHNAKRIIAIRESISGTEPTSDALRLGLAAAIEPLSKVRKDGRALRLVTKPKRRVDETIRAKLEAIAADCKALKGRIAPCATVLEGDGRSPLSLGLHEESFDLVFTSPPYPNNIDYSEVYKLELWLMGHIRTSVDFLRLRHSTFRSHPTHEKSSKLPDPFLQELDSGELFALLGRVLNRIDESAESWRSRLLKAYFADLWCSVSQFHRILRKGGFAVFVVGNSLHGAEDAPFLVPTDLILAKIASIHGFEVRCVAVARNLKRRLSGNHYLRESLVVLKKNV